MNEKSTLGKYISFYQANPNAFLQDILEIKLPFFKRAAIHLIVSTQDAKSVANLICYIIASDSTNEQKEELLGTIWRSSR